MARASDVAVGTFYNHFESVDEAIDAAVEPLRTWVLAHGLAVLDADDFDDALCAWVADFLTRLERDGRDFQVARMAKRPLLAPDHELVTQMRERWGERWSERGITPGAAGPVMVKIMCMCGDLYGGRPMTHATADHLARMVLAPNTNDADELAAQVELTLEHRTRTKAGAQDAG